MRVYIALTKCKNQLTFNYSINRLMIKSDSFIKDLVIIQSADFFLTNTYPIFTQKLCVC